MLHDLSSGGLRLCSEDRNACPGWKSKGLQRTDILQLFISDKASRNENKVRKTFSTSFFLRLASLLDLDEKQNVHKVSEEYGTKIGFTPKREAEAIQRVGDDLAIRSVRGKS